MDVYVKDEQMGKETDEEGRKMLEHEYEKNKEFRMYVDKYCRQHGITVKQAFNHKIVEYAFIMYKFG